MHIKLKQQLLACFLKWEAIGAAKGLLLALLLELGFLQKLGFLRDLVSQLNMIIIFKNIFHKIRSCLYFVTPFTMRHLNRILLRSIKALKATIPTKKAAIAAMYIIQHKIVHKVFFSLPAVIFEYSNFKDSSLSTKSKYILSVSPLAIAMSNKVISPETADQATYLIKIIAELVERSFTKEQIISYILERYKLDVSTEEIGYAIKKALHFGLLRIDDVRIHFSFLIKETAWTTTEQAISTVTNKGVSSLTNNLSSSTPASSTGTATPNPPLDSSPDKTGSIMNSVTNFVSEHKVAILIGGGLIIVAGIVVYVLSKRKGRNPPSDSGVSLPQNGPVKSEQNLSDDDLIFQIIFILSLLSLSLFFSLCSLTTLINYGYSS